MKTNRQISQKKTVRRLSGQLFVLTALLLLGALSSWWMIRRTDNNMRNDLLIQAKMVSAAVNAERIKNLTGTEADLTSPDYQRLKEQFALMCAPNSRCRFIYLMGRRADGSVFFFLDNEPAGSKDEVQPGEVYDDIPSPFLNVFADSIPGTVGPYTDKWGTFISAVIPITDPQSGKFIAVLGMDIDAHNWNWNIAARAAIPVGVTIFVFFLIFFIVRLRKSNAIIKSSEEKFSKVFYLNPSASGLSEFDTQKYIEVNDAFCVLFGFSKDEVLGKTAVELGILSLETRSAILKNADINGKVTNVETELKTKNGDIKHVLMSAEYLNIQDKKYRYTVVNDITERKQTEKMLRESEEKHRLLIENYHDIIYTLSADGFFMFVSPSWTTLLGHPVTDVTGQSFLKFVHPDDVPNCYAWLQKVIDTGERQDGIEYRVQHADGTWYWHTSSAVPLRDIAGLITGFEGNSRDITERKRVEDALLNSEAQKKAILNGITSNIALVDKELKILWANKTAVSSINKQSGDIIGQPCYLFWGDKVAPCTNCPTLKAFQTGKSEHIIVETPDGRIWDEKGEPILDSKGNVTYVVEIAQDITERKRMEDALKESEKRYRTTIDNISDAFFILDNDLRFTYFNSQAELILQQKSSDMLGKQIFSEVFKEAKGSVFEEKYLYTLTTRETTIFETFFGIDPYTNWYEVRVYPGLEGISVFFTIITERKKADSLMRLSLAKYQTLFDLFPVGITISDSKGGIIETNGIAKRLLGLDPEQQKQRNIDSKEWQIIRPDGTLMPASEYASTRALNENRTIENVEMGIVKDNDQITWLNVSATPIPIDEYGVAIIYTDLTDRKEAEQSLLIAKEKLEKTNSEKDKFFSIIAHDLRSPFHSFIGLTEIMATDSRELSLEEFTKYSIELHSLSQNLYKLLENLLEWSLLKKDSIPFTPDELYLSDILSQSIEPLQKSAFNKGITVLNQIPVSQKIYADEKMVNSVFRNLFSNAIKFSERDGTIIFSSTQTENNMVEIAVTDFGIGMSEELRNKLFVIEEKTGRKGTVGEKSTGLGLLLCKEFVEKNGGKLSIQSQIGKGSTFSFTLPVNKS
ncbi:MAG: PAS domain S-box protein [Ignavibacteriaceae bacterium]